MDLQNESLSCYRNRAVPREFILELLANDYFKTFICQRFLGNASFTSPLVQVAISK